MTPVTVRFPDELPRWANFLVAYHDPQDGVEPLVHECFRDRAEAEVRAKELREAGDPVVRVLEVARGHPEDERADRMDRAAEQAAEDRWAAIQADQGWPLSGSRGR